MTNFRDSAYYHKRGNIFFDSRACYGRDPDTIIFWYALTPTGRISKFWAALRFNSERNVRPAGKEKLIQNYHFPKMPKGYTWSDPTIYSGSV